MSTTSPERCPECGEAGATVEPITLESLLTAEASRRVRETSYRFCGTSTCKTVYFPEDGSDSFEKSDLTVRVGIKETSGPRPVCYCFDHSVEEIEAELRATGETDVLDDIKTRMQEACWCETKSPQGRCCLGLVTRVVREARAALGQVPGPDAPRGAFPTERALGAAALLAALTASACCWLPLGLAAVGLSGAAASTVLGAYRPHLLLATVALLATAFALTGRPASAGSCCGPESTTCETPGRGPASRRGLWAAAALALALAIFPSYSGVLAPEPSLPEAQPGSTSWVLGVQGMTCAGCAAHVRSTLEAVPGVEGASVRYEEGSAHVVASATVTREALEAAVRSAGYWVRADRRLDPTPSAP